MSKEQIKSNFKANHKDLVSDVAEAQFLVMEAQAKLANARLRQRELEKQFRLDMAAPDDNQLTLPLAAPQKK
jgi:hypothetical protein